jgi:hypothetical protein
MVENGERIHIWSDLGVKIRLVETGQIYEDVIGIYPHPWTYVETDEFIDDEQIEDGEAFNILTGNEDE